MAKRCCSSASQYMCYIKYINTVGYRGSSVYEVYDNTSKFGECTHSSVLSIFLSLTKSASAPIFSSLLCCAATMTRTLSPFTETSSRTGQRACPQRSVQKALRDTTRHRLEALWCVHWRCPAVSFCAPLFGGIRFFLMLCF